MILSSKRPWRIAQAEVRLFDPAHGPAALAARLLHEDRSDESLARYKLAEPLLATGRYMMAVEDAVRIAAPELLRRAGTRGLERVLRIVAPDEALRFQSRIADTGRALLWAWLDEHCLGDLLHGSSRFRLSSQGSAEGEQPAMLERKGNRVHSAIPFADPYFDQSAQGGVSPALGSFRIEDWRGEPPRSVSVLNSRRLAYSRPRPAPLIVAQPR